MLRILLILFLLIITPRLTIAEPVDAIVARVNGEPIMLSQLREAIFDQDLGPAAPARVSLEGDLFRRALTLMVDDTLLAQQAEAEGVEPDEATSLREVEWMLAELERRLGSPAEQERYLRERGLTLDELREILLARERRRNLATEAVARRVPTDGASIEAYAAERRERGEPLSLIRLAQILTRAAAPGAEQAAWDLAREAQRDPERFAELAARHSEDGATRAVGGDLGWLDPTALRPELADAVEGLRVGEISQPLRTAEGWHVVRLLGRRDVRDLYFAAAFEAERERLVRQLRAQARIKVYDPRAGG